jgi:hypothetical protein
MNVLEKKLSKDIKGIIRIYLLPCRKLVKYCGDVCLNQELYGATWWIKHDLDTLYLKTTGYVKQGKFWWCSY